MYMEKFVWEKPKGISIDDTMVEYVKRRSLLRRGLISSEDEELIK